MAEVKTFNGTEPGTDSDMVKYTFTGSPNGLFTHMPKVGEYRVMTVTVECTSAGHKKNRDGSYPAANWAMREAIIGREAEAPAKPEKKSKKKDEDHDPDQMTVDDALAEGEADPDADPVVDGGEPDADSADPANDYDPFNTEK